jgi:acetate kinase
LYLIQEKGMDAQALEDLLYRKSGLLGVSGVSSDMRDLLASDSPHAREAVDLFVYCIVRELGAMTAAAGGMDALVFTAGIGEHAPPIRAAVCSALTWLGLRLDGEANKRNETLVSAPDSAVPVYVIPTNEELMIARHTRGLVPGRAQGTGSINGGQK